MFCCFCWVAERSFHRESCDNKSKSSRSGRCGRKVFFSGGEENEKEKQSVDTFCFSLNLQKYFKDSATASARNEMLRGLSFFLETRKRKNISFC